MSQATYSDDFYRDISVGKDAYKKLLVPLIDMIRPASVVDFGAGAGTWLAAAKELGVGTVLGIDGPWASTTHRLVEPAEFMTLDMEGDLPEVGRFDLAISLEVLEHISDEAGARAVKWLCARSDVILFSAAIPMQGGTHHVNELWQSVWARRFATEGYVACDIIRPLVWHERSIPWWYRQNTVIYARPSVASGHGWRSCEPEALDLVHPEHYLKKVDVMNRLRARSIGGRLKHLRRSLGLSRR